MSLVNLNAEEINKAILANYHSACNLLLTMRHEKFLSLIRLADKIFGEVLSVSIDSKVANLTRSTIQTTGEVCGVVVIGLNSCFEKRELTFMFEDELGYWLLMGSHNSDQIEFSRNLILTQMLSEILEFEVSLAAFKMIEILNKLREP